ncbi:MAG: hypothetical protein FD165_154 [Gammaproteobacteria bacterium]|nr:MAG: hypothetical protein FD165_154 [Gammaproteobacteria bacterium]TND06732.1 MAG: hypothetical protein FD120_464 [Gammaproteobacteria bacterium]
MWATRIMLMVVVSGVVAPAQAEPVAVIVNSENTQALSSADVRNMYEDNVIVWSNGDPVRPYHLSTKSDAREVFSKNVLDKSAMAAARFWANKKITNTAKNPPETSNELLVINEVLRNRQAIGYVPLAMVKKQDGVRIVLTVE